MKSNAPDLDVPVLVAGAGPAGLMTCLVLARHGVPSLLVERHAGESILPRALGINERSMEIFRSLGLEAEIKAASVDVRGLPYIVDMDTLQGPVLETIPWTGSSDPEAADSASPVRLAFCAQNRLEPLLQEKLADTGFCEVRRGTELTAFGQDGSAVTSRLRERSTDIERHVRAAYLVGADGAYGTVREGLGIQMQGHDHLSRQLNILFDADLSRILGGIRSILYQVRHPWLPVPCLFRPVDGRLRWSLITGWFEDPSPARCAELIRLCAADAKLQVEIVAVGEWEAATLLGERFRDRRVFLAGDAAHRVTPAGAFGMNTAIQTAHNLGWKLGAVLRGWSGPGLLDSFEAERRPWAGQTVDLSYRLWGQPRRAAGRTWGHVLGAVYESGAVVPDGIPEPEVADPVAEYVPSARPGRRAPHRWITLDGKRVSTLDLFGGGFVVLSPSEVWCASAREVAATLALPLSAHVIADRGWADLYEVGSRGAVLVRPDGHVAWRSRQTAPDPRAELIQVLATILDLGARAAPAVAAAGVERQSN